MLKEAAASSKAPLTILNNKYYHRAELKSPRKDSDTRYETEEGEHQNDEYYNELKRELLDLLDFIESRQATSKDMQAKKTKKSKMLTRSGSSSGREPIEKLEAEISKLHKELLSVEEKIAETLNSLSVLQSESKRSRVE